MSSQSSETHLVRSAAQAATELDRSIAVGRGLLAELQRSPLPVPERLEQFGAKYWDWHEANAALLESVFSTNEIAQRYDEIAIEKGLGSVGFADLLRDLAQSLQRDVAFLIGLLERLRAFDAPRR